MAQAQIEKSVGKTYTPRNIYLESRYRLAQLNQRIRRAILEREKGSVRSGTYDDAHATKVGDFYDTHHESFMRVYGSVIQAFRTRNVDDLLDHQIKSMSLRPGQTVLDAGCGVGRPAVYFAKKAGVQVDAITISQKQYADALSCIEAESLSGQVRVVRGDYHRLQEHFAASSYDVIYFLESFGHSTAKEYLLDVCWTMLKPGGLLYIKDLFRRITAIPKHRKQISAEVRKINESYRYDIAELNDVLTYIRQKGYILTSVTTVDLKLEDFEDLSISNEFQNLTGIARIENWRDYVFPVEFFEIKCLKPDYDINQRLDRYFLQHLYHRQVQSEGEQPGAMSTANGNPVKATR
jgi:ubiquinone/menaquinone biosynthesis C-methylase UbiE